MTIQHRHSPKRRRSPWLYIALLSLPWMLLSQTGWTQTLFKSTTKPVVLLELYTSEGCSSCPPADRWLSGLTNNGDLWHTLFPISFHVDYWDYLGWDDPFANSAWSNRQRHHARLGNTNGVYTPGMLASGREWHGWRRHRPVPKFQPEGTLALKVSTTTGQFTARYENDDTNKGALNPNSSDKPPVNLKVALLGFGLETHVNAGENRGRLLKHDFVVLDVVEQNSQNGNWRAKLPSSPHAKNAKRLALVAWVSDPGKQRPIQITGGWLTP